SSLRFNSLRVIFLVIAGADYSGTASFLRPGIRPARPRARPAATSIGRTTRYQAAETIASLPGQPWRLESPRYRMAPARIRFAAAAAMESCKPALRGLRILGVSGIRR